MWSQISLKHFCQAGGDFLGCCTAALESPVVQAGCQLEVGEMVGGVGSSLFCSSSVVPKLVAKCWDKWHSR